jgi:hypothetical protein
VEIRNLKGGIYYGFRKGQPYSKARVLERKNLHADPEGINVQINGLTAKSIQLP